MSQNYSGLSPVINLCLNTSRVCYHLIIWHHLGKLRMCNLVNRLNLVTILLISATVGW